MIPSGSDGVKACLREVSSDVAAQILLAAVTSRCSQASQLSSAFNSQAALGLSTLPFARTGLRASATPVSFLGFQRRRTIIH